MTKEQIRLKYYNDMIDSFDERLYPLVREAEKFKFESFSVGYDEDVCLSRFDADLVELYANTIGRLYYFKARAEDDLNYDESNI